MGEINVGDFTRKNPVPREQPAAEPKTTPVPDPLPPPPEEEAEPEEKKRPLTERLRTGEATKTSLYLDRDVHRALKRLAADLSYGQTSDGRVYGAVSAQEVILLGIGMAVAALTDGGGELICGDRALLDIDR